MMPDKIEPSENAGELELLEKAEQLRVCPICRGSAQRFERTIGPGACCDGERDCPWYRVVVPLAAWQRLPRVSDGVRRVLDDMLREVELCAPDRTLVSLGRVTKWRRILAREIDEQVGVWMNAYADACLKLQSRDCSTCDFTSDGECRMLAEGNAPGHPCPAWAKKPDHHKEGS